jgi:hypothetical protein
MEFEKRKTKKNIEIICPYCNHSNFFAEVPAAIWCDGCKKMYSMFLYERHEKED